MQMMVAQSLIIKKKKVQFHQFLGNDVYVGEAEGGLLSLVFFRFHMGKNKAK